MNKIMLFSTVSLLNTVSGPEPPENVSKPKIEALTQTV